MTAFNVDELFGRFDDSDEHGASAECGINSLVEVTSSDLPHVLTLKEFTVKVTGRDEDGDEVQVFAKVENRLNAPLRLANLQLLLRDDADFILEHHEVYNGGKFRHVQETVEDLTLRVATLAHTARLEVLADCVYEFRGLLAVCDLEANNIQGDKPLRRRWPAKSRPVPLDDIRPNAELKLSVYAGHAHDSYTVDVILEVKNEQTPFVRTLDLMAGLRDKGGQLLCRTDGFVEFESVASTSYASLEFFDLDKRVIRKAKTLEIAGKGECERRVHLGNFRIK